VIEARAAHGSFNKTPSVERWGTCRGASNALAQHLSTYSCKTQSYKCLTVSQSKTGTALPADKGAEWSEGQVVTGVQYKAADAEEIVAKAHLTVRFCMGDGSCHPLTHIWTYHFCCLPLTCTSKLMCPPFLKQISGTVNTLTQRIQSYC